MLLTDPVDPPLNENRLRVERVSVALRLMFTRVKFNVPSVISTTEYPSVVPLVISNAQSVSPIATAAVHRRSAVRSPMLQESRK